MWEEWRDRLDKAWFNFTEGLGKKWWRWVVLPTRKALAWLRERAAFWLWSLFSMVLIMTGAGMAYWMYERQIGTVLNAEVTDFLQVAANVAEGKGMTTFVLRPFALSPNFSPEPMTDLYHPPFLTLIWGILFALLGKARMDFSVLFSGILIGATAAFLFSLTARLVNRWVGFLVVILFFLSPLTLLIAGMGHPAPLGSLLFLAWVAVMVSRPKWTKRRAVFSGTLLGLTGWTQGLALFAAPVALFSRRWEPKTARLWFLGAFLLTLLPYGWRNFRWSGTPLTPWKAYALLLDTEAFPADSIYRHAFEKTPSPLTLAAQNIPAIVKKMRENIPFLPALGRQWRWLPLLSLLIAPIVIGWRGSPLRFVGVLFLSGTAFTVLLLLSSRVWVEATFFLLPLGCLLTGGMIGALPSWVTTKGWWKKVPLPRRLSWLRVASLPLVLFFVATLLQGAAAFHLLQRLVPIRFNPPRDGAIWAQRLFPNGKALIGADEPRLFAFYWRRPVLWLPCHQKDWEQLKLQERVTHIWLSPAALRRLGGDADRALRVALITGKPFLRRFAPLVLPDKHRRLFLTPFLVAGKKELPTPPLPEGVKPVAHKPIRELIESAMKYMGEKNYAKAEQLLITVARRLTGTTSRRVAAVTFFSLGNLWLQQNRLWDAVKAFKASLGEAPSFFAANNLAWTYLQLYEHRQRSPYLLHQAEFWAEYALRLCPPNNPKRLAQVLDTAAWVDFWRGKIITTRKWALRWRLKRALSRLLYAHRLLPNDPEINYHLAMVYTELGEIETAQKFLEKAENLGLKTPR